MAARAIWKGILNLGDRRLPVKVYSAAQDRKIHFHLLHDQDQERIKQRLASSVTGETVAYDELRRGVAVDGDRLVVLDRDELAELDPPASRDIELGPFVPRSAISHQWYDRPYYLKPDGQSNEYFALAEALDRSGREGIARWVMRKKEYVGALSTHRGHLTLMTLRHPDEVILAEQLDPPEGREFDPRELKLAEQLLTTLKADFDPEQYHDAYRERVAQLIETKREGRTPVYETPEAKPESDSLLDALEASLQTSG